MGNKLEQIEKGLQKLQNGSQMETFCVYPGMELSFLRLKAGRLSMNHASLEHVIEINYCHSGRMGWEMATGNSVYLGPGDYSLHAMSSCASSVMTLPNGFYEGLTLCIDLTEFDRHLPESLRDTGITGVTLYHKFCKSGSVSSFAGNVQTEGIFSGFYEKPDNLKTAYWKIKSIELLLYLGQTEPNASSRLTEYQSEQVEIIRQIHEQLIGDLRTKTTIEALAKQHLMNVTTLKTLFKAVYGTSIAAHIKEHRMEQAALLLRETSDSIAVVARSVGYESQSKFTSAFKDYFDTLPTEYRKYHRIPSKIC